MVNPCIELSIVVFFSVCLWSVDKSSFGLQLFVFVLHVCRLMVLQWSSWVFLTIGSHPGGGHKHKRGHIASTNFSSRANLRRRASRMARPFFDDFAAVAAAMVLRSKRTFACMLGPRYLRVRSCAVVASRASTCRDLWACAYRCTHTRLHTCVESVRGHGGGVGASGRAHGSGVDPPARKARSGEVARLSATRREGAMRRDSMGVTGNP